MKTRFETRLHLAVLTVIAIAAAHSTGAAPTFQPASPLDANVLSMSADGSVLVGSQIFGAYAFLSTREGGVEILGPAGGQVSVSRDGSTIGGLVP